jgi:phosphoribosylformylglycinamidine cyclo-ligase
VGAEISLASWDEPPVFRIIREAGRVPEDDMRRTFNLGVGMIMAVAPEHSGVVLEMLAPHGPGWLIGRCIEGAGVRFTGARND